MEEYVKLSDVREMLGNARLVGDEYNVGYQTDDINLKQLPIADVEPVKHAKWIDTGSGQECSLCGEIQYGYDSHRYRCACCGARMDKE